MSAAACKRFFHLSPGADTRAGALVRCGSSPGRPLRCAVAGAGRMAAAAPVRHEVNDLETVSRNGPNVGEHEGSIPRRYCFNFSRKCLRNLATLGATTAWQYGWYGLRE